MTPADFRRLLDVMVPGRKLKKLYIHFGNPRPTEKLTFDVLEDGVYVEEVIFIGKWLLNNIMSFLTQLAGFSILNLQFSDCIDIDCNVSIS